MFENLLDVPVVPRTEEMKLLHVSSLQCNSKVNPAWSRIHLQNSFTSSSMNKVKDFYIICKLLYLDTFICINSYRSVLFFSRFNVVESFYGATQV